MKKLYQLSIIFMVLASATRTMAQDIPLFSQKMTNSFIYNPAMAGLEYGSATISYRSHFSNVNGAARDNFFSVHAPFVDHHIGVGVNLFSEQVNFVNNIYTSAAFAYHLDLGAPGTLSMGLATEYNSLGFDQNEVIGDTDDPVIEERQSRLDFSFGLNYQHPYFTVGVSSNRMASLFDIGNKAHLLSGYYSAYAAGQLPVRGGVDQLEPTFTYRKLSGVTNIWNTGLYYTYNNLVLAGVSYQKGDLLSFTAAIKAAGKLWVGYSYEIVNTTYKANLGSTSEITLRYDFKENNSRD
ncbi:MAG: PorP/SprF family type IX secretion system membrane protein, partial [Cyclobacteriaceae bacterium]